MSVYVLGFRFRQNNDVALISKIKPAFQAGKLNGIGGKVEEFDLTPAHAMVREFKEETGADTTISGWRYFGILNHGVNKIYLFVSHGDVVLTKTTDEQPGWYPPYMLKMLPVMGNLHWLIPLALDKDNVTAIIVDETVPIMVTPA